MSSAPRSPLGPASSIERPLDGATIAVPGVREADALSGLLTRAGAAVPRFKPAPVSDERAIERWLSELVEGEFDDVVFFSAQGVRLVCEIARQLGRETSVLEALRGTRLIAQGGRTVRALSEFGLNPTVRSASRAGESLLEIVAKLDVAGRVVGLQPRDPGEGGPLIADLELRGAKVHVAGRSVDPDAGAIELLDDISDGTLQGIVFFGASQVTWLWDAALGTGRTVSLTEALGRVCVVATESASEALRDRGVRSTSVAARLLDGSAKLEDVRALFRVQTRNGSRGERPAGKKRLVV
ncbi:MAG TPA: uroporphyrinogen-III synthase, partial [Polyangiaceae bacterium]